MSNIAGISPDVLQQDKKRLERLSEDIVKLYRSVSDLPNKNAYEALCIACEDATGLTIGQLRQKLTGLQLIIDRTLRGILEHQGLPPSKRTLRRVKEVIEPWTAWWAPYWPKPPLFEFTAQDIERLANNLGRFPYENVRAFLGHRPRRLLIRTRQGMPSINGALIEGVEMHVRGWIAERRRFREQMPRKKARSNPRPSRTYDIEQLQLMAGRLERIHDGLFDGGLHGRLASDYVYVHECYLSGVQDAAQSLRLLGQCVATAVDLVRAWPDIRKPFERDLVMELAIDYKLAFGEMPSAARENTTFMLTMGALEEIVAEHGYDLEIGCDLARRVIEDEIAPV